MSKNQFFYPVRDADDTTHVTLVPIPEETYRTIMPKIERIRKQMQRSGRCLCTQSKLWMCDADCLSCPFRAAGNTYSLDAPVEGTSNVMLGDTLESDKPSPDEIAINAELLNVLYSELDRLDPDGRRICEMMMHYSEREAAEKLGMARSTFKRHWAKIRADLQEKLKDYYL